MYIIWSPNSINFKNIYVFDKTVVGCKKKLVDLYKNNKVKYNINILNKLHEILDLEIDLDIDKDYLVEELDNYVVEEEFNTEQEQEQDEKQQKEQEEHEDWYDSEESNKSEEVIRRKNYPINIFNVNRDKSLYIRKIDNYLDKNSIYILEYIEDGGGQSYNISKCIFYEYTEDKIYKILEQTYYEESENTTNEEYLDMIKQIKKQGWCEINNPISNNCCSFTLYKLDN